MITRFDTVPVRHPDCLYMDGGWVKPSGASNFSVIDSATERKLASVAEARPNDVERAVTAARKAFDQGPWPQLLPAERAAFLRAIGRGFRERAKDIASAWISESGVISAIALASAQGLGDEWDRYAELAATFDFIEEHEPAGGDGHRESGCEQGQRDIGEAASCGDDGPKSSERDGKAGVTGAA